MRILYADDDQDEIEFFHETVKSIDPAIECIAVSRAKQALQLLESPPHPDLIVLDFHMPVMNGIDCLLRIRQDLRIKNIPVVFYTTSVTPELNQHLKEAGAFRIINKCADIVELRYELNSCFLAVKQEASGQPLQFS